MARTACRCGNQQRTSCRASARSQSSWVTARSCRACQRLTRRRRSVQRRRVGCGSDDGGRVGASGPSVVPRARHRCGNSGESGRCWCERVQDRRLTTPRRSLTRWRSRRSGRGRRPRSCRTRCSRRRSRSRTRSARRRRVAVDDQHEERGPRSVRANGITWLDVRHVKLKTAFAVHGEVEGRLGDAQAVGEDGRCHRVGAPRRGPQHRALPPTRSRFFATG